MRIKGVMELSGSQLIWSLLVIDGCNIIPFVKTAIVEAKQDAWISIMIAGVIVILLTLALVRLSLMHPGQTLTNFSQKVLGAWFGRLVILPYFVAWFSIPVLILRYSGDFIQTVLLDRSPVWVVMLVLMVLTLYCTHGGIGGIGRYNEVVGPLFFATTMISYMLNTRNLKWDRILPVFYDTGWQPILKGMVPLTTLLGGESLLLLVLIAFMKDAKKAPILSAFALGITTLAFVTVALLSLLVFGPTLAAKMQDPFFSYLRTVDIMEFIQQIDTFMFSLWMFGVTSMLSIHVFVISYEASLWLNMKNWYRLIWIVGPAVFVAALINPSAIQFEFFYIWWSHYMFPLCGIFIPFVLLIATLIGMVRTRKDSQIS
ncbi:GerAB/ArcD/ProY family transporter [Paenibacillus sp. WC2504]|uniref:GerAB/ArcD/ProY family transporter n=1 Tax=Paenibacillus sp. WC2504 TaxID=3461403 RepID=UPI0040452C1C